MRSFFSVAIALILLPGALAAQDRPTAVRGPAIEAYGATFRVDTPTFPIDMEMEYRVAFDVPTAPESPAELNRLFNSVARFLNMHLAAGVSRDNIHLALVVHGEATWGITRPEVYEEHYGTDNPNRGLINALVENGVQVIVCGQSALSRGVTKDHLATGVMMALSAMTADVTLSSRGYTLIQY